MSWANLIPAELSNAHSPLVVLTGLDIKHNAIHKEIWDGFFARNNQKFRYKLLDGDHEYPKPKNKRPEAFTIPKGIFKSNWFHKHLYLIPSLVVVFFELDWNEPNWKEKEMECATKLELVRQSLAERSTRVILILIQKHPNIPIDGDNGLARERYPSLCTACSIKNNYLFLLHAEHLAGYINKLEGDAFSEPTQLYYTLEIKSVKAKRDTLVKVTHQFLFVRLAIKIAFFNEMKQDLFKAIEYYKQAYVSLLDIRTYDTNIFEVKTIASLINYKLIHLFFDIKHPIDAIDQFRKHIDIFRNKVGSPELAFEHSAWLSKQFELMGEIFEHAIRKGYLSAVQTQHPGFYYHSAANQCIQRRANSRIFDTSLFNRQWTDETNPLASLKTLEFYGQRPWRQGHQGMDILDHDKERDGVSCLQELESKQSLTPLVTNLYQKAITHFTIFNCKRMKQYLSVCMAEEYFFAKEYQESLNIYVNVLNDYKNEHWWPILTSIMSNALKCAYLVADVTNYCLLCIELIGKNVLISQEDKSLIQANLLKVINNEIPLPESHKIDTSIHSIDAAIEKWKEELAKSNQKSSEPLGDPLIENNLEKSVAMAENKIIAAHVSSMVPFVDCKVKFLSAMFNSNQECEISVVMRTNCIKNIQFNKLYVRFNLSNYNQYCIVDEDKSAQAEASLFFEPNKIKEFKFKFLPYEQDIGRDLEVSSVSLELGKREEMGRVLVIHWKGDCKNALTCENYTKMEFAKLFTNPNKVNLSESGQILKWDSIRNVQNTSIVARKSNIDLKLEHKMPIFIDEYYAVRLTIDNLEANPIENLVLTVEAHNLIKANSPASNNKCKIWIGEIDKTQSETTKTINLNNIGIKEKLCETIYVQLKDIMSISLVVKIKYSNQNSIYTFSSDTSTDVASSTSPTDSASKLPQKQIVKCGCIQEDTVKLDSVHPFKVDFSAFSMRMKPIEVIRTGEPFLLLCEIKNEMPYTVKFKNSSLNLPSNIKFKPNLNGQCEDMVSFLKNETLKHHEMATECFSLVIEDDSSGEIFNVKKLLNLGEYSIDWRRRNPCYFSDTNESINEESEDEEADAEEATNELESVRNLFYTTTRIKLPEVNIEGFPFLVEATLPSHGNLDKHIKIVYKIKNKTSFNVLDIECSLEENESFSISGNKQETIQIMPNDSVDYSYVVYPLRSGYCKLPKFQMKLSNFTFKTSSLDSSQLQQNTSLNSPEKSIAGGEDNFDVSHLDYVVQSMLPTQIFIMPQTTNIASSS